jgi:phosphopantetheinyl transferase (holo-ACP synthase)
VAIAALAGPGKPSRAGIDLEQLDVRDASFAEDYFTAEERALNLPVEVSSPTDANSDLLTVLWSIKEAVSKALGLGLHLKTGEVLVEALAADGDVVVATVGLEGRAQETYEALTGESLEVRVEVDGSFALATAWLETREQVAATDTAGDTQTAQPQPKRSDAPDAWVDVAAVAALLKHKGLLEQRSLGESKVKGESLSPWKQ